jgi:hypothetical protein
LNQTERQSHEGTKICVLLLSEHRKTDNENV